MNQTWLSGLISCATSFRTAHNVPVYANQIGIYTAVPGAMQYVRDVLSLFNQKGVSFTYWQYRSGSDNPDDQGILYQTSHGRVTKQDWLDMLISYFK